MTLVALQHLVRSAQTLAEDCHMLICGSASLLASFPDLGDPAGPLTSTFDADICPEPFDELTGRMLDEALGEKRAYFQRHGYHADILRDSITQTFPAGWRARLIPIPDVENAHALDPHDLVAIKILVGRPKDLALVSNLNASLRLDGQVVEKRLYSISMSEAQMVRASVNFRAVFDR